MIQTLQKQLKLISRNKNNAKYDELIELEKIKMQLEGKIVEKRSQLFVHQQKAGDDIQIKSGKIRNIITNLEKTQKAP